MSTPKSDEVTMFTPLTIEAIDAMDRAAHEPATNLRYPPLFEEGMARRALPVRPVPNPARVIEAMREMDAEMDRMQREAFLRVGVPRDLLERLPDERMSRTDPVRGMVIDTHRRFPFAATPVGALPAAAVVGHRERLKIIGDLPFPHSCSSSRS